MNREMIEQIHKDYNEILSNEAGKRIFGGIFYAARINATGLKNDYQQGIRDMGMLIANTIREVNPVLIAECEKAYQEIMRSCENGDYSDDGSNTEYRIECSD